MGCYTIIHLQDITSQLAKNCTTNYKNLMQMTSLNGLIVKKALKYAPLKYLELIFWQGHLYE